jgi:DNA-binding MarR family transcriptional regulator
MWRAIFMEQLLELFFKNGLRPLNLIFDTTDLELKVNRSDLAALLMLHIHGEMPMSELAEDLGAPLSTATSLAKRLVKKGLIERNQSIKDQRILLVRLTDEGQRLALQARKIIESIIARVQATLSTDELNQFISLALKIGKALQSKEVEKLQQQDNKLRIIRIDD